jgi:hypothetical protein
MHTEAFTHTLAGFAPSPLATGTMGQRPGMACDISGRLNQVAERAARTGDCHRRRSGVSGERRIRRIPIRRYGTFAMHPNHASRYEPEPPIAVCQGRSLFEQVDVSRREEFSRVLFLVRSFLRYTPQRG